ncbi:MAG: hypothetical protein Q8O09_01395 [Bacillota bacterium]|nr:hypothetical protein [Bacillota bacterium]
MKKVILIILAAVLTLSFSACDILKEPNAYLVADTAPIFDASGRQVGQAFNGFALDLNSVRDDKAYFTMSIVDPNKPEPAATEYYIPLENLRKGYKEMEAVIEIISVDAVLVNAGAPIYDSKGNILATFDEPFGPFRFITKADEKGYMFLIANNVAFVRDADVQLIKMPIE